MRDRRHCRPRLGQPVALRHADRPAAPGAGRGGHRHVGERPPSLAAQQRHGAGRVPRRSHARPAGGGGDRSRALPDRGRGGVFGGAALLCQLSPRDRARAQRKPRQRGQSPDGPGADRAPPPEHGLRTRRCCSTCSPTSSRPPGPRASTRRTSSGPSRGCTAGASEDTRPSPSCSGSGSSPSATPTGSGRSRSARARGPTGRSTWWRRRASR